MAKKTSKRKPAKRRRRAAPRAKAKPTKGPRRRRFSGAMRRGAGGYKRAVQALSIVAGIAGASAIPWVHEKMDAKGWEPGLWDNRVGKIALGAAVLSLGMVAFWDGPEAAPIATAVTAIGAADQALVVARR